MQLIQRRERQPVGGGSGVFDGAEVGVDTTSAMVISGPYAQNLPVAGMTVGQIRERLATRLDIDPESIAVIDGRDATDSIVLGAGQALTFVTRAGEKGAEKNKYSC